PFWEHFGRHFINMTYDQADRFCQESKEFMLSLLPSEDIYLTLLVPEARAAIGSVSEETTPAKHLLERLGFAHFQRVDPFDGGPHLEAQTDSINLVRQTRLGKLGTPTDKPAPLREHGIVSVVDAEGEFRATASGYQLDKNERVVLPRDVARMLGGEPGMDVGLSPLETGSAVVLSKPLIRVRK
ncbi:MAG: arginine N-succinyltransferase, partial [bacterium]